MNVSPWKHKWCFHNRGVVGDIPVAKWAGEGREWVQEMTRCPGPRRMECGLLKMTQTAYETFAWKRSQEHPTKKPRGLDPMVLEAPKEGEDSRW